MATRCWRADALIRDKPPTQNLARLAARPLPHPPTPNVPHRCPRCRPPGVRVRFPLPRGGGLGGGVVGGVGAGWVVAGWALGPLARVRPRLGRGRVVPPRPSRRCGGKEACFEPPPPPCAAVCTEGGVCVPRRSRRLYWPRLCTVSGVSEGKETQVAERVPVPDRNHRPESGERTPETYSALG